MKNQIINVKCIDMTVDFYGVCRYEGLVVFVKGLILDEVANVKIIKEKKNIAYGIIDELIVKSKYRIKEECKVGYKCGGCDTLHINYEYSLFLKKKIVQNIFNNAKLDVLIKDVLPSSNIFRYRNKMQVPTDNNKVGYYRKHSNDIVEFDDCLLSSQCDNKVLKYIKELIIKHNLMQDIRHIVIRSNNDNESLVCLVVNKDIKDINLNIYKTDFLNDLTFKFNNITSLVLNVNNSFTNVIFNYDLGSTFTILGDTYNNLPYISESCGLKYLVPYRSFYQVNHNQMKVLYDLIVSNGELSSFDYVADLYCGVGTIALYISQYVKHVDGYEIVEDSISFARKNALINNISNVDFFVLDACEFNNSDNKYNAVVVDPPRKGLSSKLINTIINSSIDKVIYISCDQGTLARDLKEFSSYFDIGSVQLVDMFPMTKHVESITVLKRK